MNRWNKIIEIRSKLRAGGSSVGGWMQITCSTVAEIMGGGVFDWVAVDMEHGSSSLSDLPDIFRALEIGNTLPMIRLPSSDIYFARNVLDAGAGGIIIPMVNSAEQLSKIVTEVCWPPVGVRGVGYSRANHFGRDFSVYIDEGRAPLIVAMIETAEGLKNIDAILKVGGLDGVFLGPYDLSASLGVLGDFKNPRFVEATNIFLSKSRAAKVPAGIHVVDPDRLQLMSRLDEGYQFVAYSTDAAILLNGTKHDLR